MFNREALRLPPPPQNIDSSRAFTLAEVLITLGIIGVVAALTLPALIYNYQKQVWVNQLKKSVSTLEQGFQKMLADDGVDNLVDTTVWSNMGYSDTIVLIEGARPNGFEKYFKFNYVGQFPVTQEYYYLNGTLKTLRCYYTLNFNDGLMIRDYVFLKHEMYPSIIGYILIDVNGNSKPNTYGRDIFYFWISNNGKLLPDGGKNYAIARGGDDITNSNYYWRNDTEYCGTPAKKDANQHKGEGCAARIIENGWTMDY